MTIYHDKLDKFERNQLLNFEERSRELDIIYDEAWLHGGIKESDPFMKMLRFRRDEAMERLHGFENYLIVNGLASPV